MRLPGWAPWLVAFCADEHPTNFNILVVTIYKSSERKLSITKQSVQRSFHKISHVTLSVTLHVTSCIMVQFTFVQTGNHS